MSLTKNNYSGLMTVGIKILVGVAVTSNLFIGALLYVNLQSSDTVHQKVNAVLSIREKLSSNLRAAIFTLQGEFLALPDFFKIDPRAGITKAVEQAFRITDRQLLNGRAAYTSFYNRKERIDLAKNKFVIQTEDGKLTISSGIFDQNGNFQETVERMNLASNNPEEDKVKLRSLIETVSENLDSSNTLRQRINEFGAKVADESLTAEATRTEILQHVEEIRAMEHELSAFRAQQRRFSLIMGGLAVLANMIVLFILVRMFVEKPLHKLTHTIDAIRSGKSPEIPYQQRKDQIGVLSGAISNFREALLDIRNENERKIKEKVIIEEMFTTITSVVNRLEGRAKQLVYTAYSLQDLAVSTETQAENVTQRAGDTAKHTNSVSESTVQLQSAFQEINIQIQDQNSIVATILESNTRSKHYNEQLNDSIKAITTIIATVEDITSQTKLLALNATIEAARAGAAGKGFGVVASEVKELSYRTAKATDDVMNKIEAIQAASAVLFTNLEEIDQRMQTLKQRTGNITGAVTRQQLVTDTIATLASRTSENTLTVSTNINEVSTAATSTRDLAGQVHVFSSEISSQLTNLLQETTTKIQQLADFSNPESLSPLKNIKTKEPLGLVASQPEHPQPMSITLLPTGT